MLPQKYIHPDEDLPSLNVPDVIDTASAKISKLTGQFTPEEIAIIKKTVAKNTTDTELAYFLITAKNVRLNPFLKEIWCYKDSRGNLLVFAARDGFLKLAQCSPSWNGLTSGVVFSKDEFEMDIPGQKISHKFGTVERGEIIGAYAMSKPKGVDYATLIWADLKTYDKKQFVWSSHKEEMIQKVAEIHCLKKAYGINGLQCEDDFTINNGVVVLQKNNFTETKKDSEEKITKLLKKNEDIPTK